MNVQLTPSVMAPYAPRTLAETGISMVMMRDILLKTMFRMNIDLVSQLSLVICLPVSGTACHFVGPPAAEAGGARACADALPRNWVASRVARGLALSTMRMISPSRDLP